MRPFQQQQNRMMRAIKGQVTAMIGRVSSVFGYGAVSVEGFDEDRGARLAGPFGVQGLPPVGTEVQIVCNWGSRHQVVVVGAIAEVVGELEPGEAHVFSSGGARIHCKHDGSVEVNGGTAAVARVGDTVEVMIGGEIYTGKITSGSASFKA